VGSYPPQRITSNHNQVAALTLGISTIHAMPVLIAHCSVLAQCSTLSACSMFNAQCSLHAPHTPRKYCRCGRRSSRSNKLTCDTPQSPPSPLRTHASSVASTFEHGVLFSAYNYPCECGMHEGVWRMQVSLLPAPAPRRWAALVAKACEQPVQRPTSGHGAWRSSSLRGATASCAASLASIREAISTKPKRLLASPHNHQGSGVLDRVPILSSQIFGNSSTFRQTQDTAGPMAAPPASEP
jgi:hypothetical protein